MEARVQAQLHPHFSDETRADDRPGRYVCAPRGSTRAEAPRYYWLPVGLRIHVVDFDEHVAGGTAHAARLDRISARRQAHDRGRIFAVRGQCEIARLRKCRLQGRRAAPIVVASPPSNPCRAARRGTADRPAPLPRCTAQCPASAPPPGSTAAWVRSPEMMKPGVRTFSPGPVYPSVDRLINFTGAVAASRSYTSAMAMPSVTVPLGTIRTV